MSSSLPPRIETTRAAIARSHNRRIVIVAMIWFATCFAGLQVAKVHQTGGFTLIALSFVMILTGTAFMARQTRLQSEALGFVCPLCGKSLYEPRHGRLSSSGECPHCKQPILDHLRDRIA